MSNSKNIPDPSREGPDRGRDRQGQPAAQDTASLQYLGDANRLGLQRGVLAKEGQQHIGRQLRFGHTRLPAVRRDPAGFHAGQDFRRPLHGRRTPAKSQARDRSGHHAHECSQKTADRSPRRLGPRASGCPGGGSEAGATAATATLCTATATATATCTCTCTRTRTRTRTRTQHPHPRQRQRQRQPRRRCRQHPHRPPRLHLPPQRGCPCPRPISLLPLPALRR
jgi:hypothetical protein